MPSRALRGSPVRQPVRGRLLVVAIFLVALNLRATLASLPPLVQTIRSDLGLSGAVAGLLTTLPVLCMGVFAPVAQRLAHRIGREATLGPFHLPRQDQALSGSGSDPPPRRRRTIR